MTLLGGVRVLECGGRAAAICGELFAQLGADVLRLEPPGLPAWEPGEAERLALFASKRIAANSVRFDERARDADLLVLDLPPRPLDALGIDPAALAAENPRLVVAAITPFGLSGPRRDFRGGDLVAFHSSGIARLLVGHVADAETEPPVRAAGEQSDFITALTAACAAIQGLYQQQRTGRGQLIDISAQEAMSLMAARELAMPGFGGQPAAREGREAGGSAVIPVLPASDGFVAISPREAHQWVQWLKVTGDPAWGADPRFTTRAGRTKHYPELFEHMAPWSRSRTRHEIFELCQAAHVPCFPFGAPADMIDEPQLRHRGFFAPLHAAGGPTVSAPRPPFGLPAGDYAPVAPPADGDGWLPGDPVPATGREAARLPLEGVRVLDFSWVIAGPTSTRYLALMGAEVIKIESPDRPDTGRVSELHDVLGESKFGLALDLKAPGALEAVRTLLAGADVVVENFATGVMERLGLGYADLRTIRPDIVLLSASGLGRTGPGAHWVAYGNLISAYSGFAALNGPQGDEPRTGLAWADPLCGLFMAFAVTAALHHRDRGGGGRHIDFSMLEGLLWTMPRALIEPQITGRAPAPEGNGHERFCPHGVYRADGDDRWLAIAIRDEDEWSALCRSIPDLGRLTGLDEGQRRAAREEIDGIIAGWAKGRDAIEAMDELQAAGVPASASYTTNDLFADSHLWERDFYRPVVERDGTERFLPGLPWRWGDGELVAPRAAPGLGEHNSHVLRELAGLTAEEFERLGRQEAPA